MLNMTDELLRLVWCEESLKGLADLMEVYKTSVIELGYISTDYNREHMLQTVISSLRGFAEEIARIGNSLDHKEIEESAAVRTLISDMEFLSFYHNTSKEVQTAIIKILRENISDPDLVRQILIDSGVNAEDINRWESFRSAA